MVNLRKKLWYASFVIVLGLANISEASHDTASDDKKRDREVNSSESSTGDPGPRKKVATEKTVLNSDTITNIDPNNPTSPPVNNANNRQPNVTNSDPSPTPQPGNKGIYKKPNRDPPPAPQPVNNANDMQPNVTNRDPSPTSQPGNKGIYKKPNRGENNPTPQPVNNANNRQPFDYNSTEAAQAALTHKKFCGSFDEELAGHFPPPIPGKTYFCRKGNIQTLESLQNVLSQVTLFSCQKDKEHNTYQRCLVDRFKTPIEGCTGHQSDPNHDQKMTHAAVVLYNPEIDCIITAFPPYNQHGTDPCSIDCSH